MTASPGPVKTIISPADRARLSASLLIRLRCFGRTKPRGAIAARSCTTFDIGSSFASSMRQGAPNHDHWPTPHLPPSSVHLRTAAYVIREGHLSQESGRRQTARGASNGTVREERIRKGGGALEVTRPTKLSRPRRNNNEAAYQARTVTVKLQSRSHHV